MPKSYDSATVELAMTLSTLAYVDENRTATQQQMIGKSTLVWRRQDTRHGRSSGGQP